jgi:hypothetical protein
MIQRIQSLYLLLVLILGVLCFFIPYATFNIDGTYIADIKATGVEFIPNAVITASMNMILLTLNIAIIDLLSLIIIFLFKKRKLQMTLIKINMVFVIISVVCMFLFADIIKAAINAEIRYYFAALFPILSLLFLYLALRAINKDEDLVKAADRLR